MSFLLDADFAHNPRPLGLHALKLRLALMSIYYAHRERLPGRAPRLFGGRVSSVHVRHMIGLGGANDARALRRAAAELHDDPAYQTIDVSPDGRLLGFVLDPRLCRVTHMPHYAVIENGDFQRPSSIADFHLSIRYAQARKMKAPASKVPPAGAAAMAGPGRRPDQAWARRTLLPAACRVAAHIGGLVFVGAVWPVGPALAPALRFHFGGPGSAWTPDAMGKAQLDEHAWLCTAGGFERLHRPRFVPVTVSP